MSNKPNFVRTIEPQKPSQDTQNQEEQKLSEDPVAAAKAILQAQAQERVMKCQAAIQAALQDHDCIMIPKLVIEGSKIETDIVIQALQ